jgi:DNA-binding protein YbaB
MLQAYAEDLQTQVLVNDKNTVAINPNIWNYKKAILADIIAFAQNANGKEFSKICPVDVKLYNNKSFVSAINEVKKAKNTHYIFFTPDTIFSEPYVYDKKQFKDDFRKMKEQMNSAKHDWEKMAINLNLGKNIDKLKHDPAWAGNYSVQFDKNTCRVNMPNMVQEIPMPDFDSIVAQVERATDILKDVTINVPDMSGLRSQINFNYKMDIPGHSSKEMKIKVDLDSVLTNSKKFQHQFYSFGPNGQINVDSLVESIKSMLPDSMTMKEFQNEMKKFQKQMMELQKELQKNNKTNTSPKKPVEI